MRELCLSYAGFVYYLNKKGYKIRRHGRNCLSLWLDYGKFFYFQLLVDEAQADCGCVYTNYNDLIHLFRDDIELLQTIMTECIKPRSSDGKWLPHCSIDPSLKGKIETFIESEEMVCCLSIP